LESDFHREGTPAFHVWNTAHKHVLEEKIDLLFVCKLIAFFKTQNMHSMLHSESSTEPLFWDLQIPDNTLIGKELLCENGEKSRISASRNSRPQILVRMSRVRKDRKFIFVIERTRKNEINYGN